MLNKLIIATLLVIGTTGCWKSKTETAVEDVTEKVEATANDVVEATEEMAEEVAEEATDSPE